MATVIDELVTILGFEVDGNAKAAVDKFNSGVSTITKYVGVAAAALTAASTAITYFAENSAGAAAEIDKLSQVTGISTDALQEWGFAGEQAGGSAQSLTHDLDSLTRSMSSPIPGEFNHALFMMGISATDAAGQLKGADDVLLEIADKMKGMTAARQVQWGSKIGLSDDTIRLLQLGREEIGRLKQESQDIPTVVDEKSLKNARMFVTQLSLIRRVFSYIGQEVSSSAGPAVKALVGDTILWIKNNRDFIQLGLKNLIEGIIEGFKRYASMMKKIKDVLFDLIPGVKGFVGELDQVSVVSAVVFSALTALAVVLTYMALPWIAIGVAIVAAGLAIEDFFTYLEGGESYFGDFIGWINSLFEAFNTRFPAISDLVSQTIDTFKNLGLAIYKDVMPFMQDLWKLAKDIVSVVGEIGGAVVEGAESLLKKAGFGGANVNLMTQPSHQVQGQMQASHGGSNTISITNNITGDNAPAIASETTRKIQFGMQQAFPGGLAPVAN